MLGKNKVNQMQQNRNTVASKVAQSIFCPLRSTGIGLHNLMTRIGRDLHSKPPLIFYLFIYLRFFSNYKQQHWIDYL